MQTILIVDDHPLFRAAIREIIDRLFADKGWEVSYREASRFEEALEIATATPDLDLVTLDISMPDTNDLSGVLRFRAGFPTTPIVVVSALTDPDAMRRVMLCGAVGFIPKSSAKESMVEALQTVLAGGIYMPPEMLAEPATTRRHDDYDAGAALTPRQAAVLTKLVEGKSNKEIARELAISDMTVKVHVTAILRSLGVVTRAQAIVAVRGEQVAMG
jgi:DNA-binding NarL/FixJ family response regulator